MEHVSYIEYFRERLRRGVKIIQEGCVVYGMVCVCGRVWIDNIRVSINKNLAESACRERKVSRGSTELNCTRWTEPFSMWCFRKVHTFPVFNKINKRITHQ